MTRIGFREYETTKQVAVMHYMGAIIICEGSCCEIGASTRCTPTSESEKFLEVSRDAAVASLGHRELIESVKRPEEASLVDARLGCRIAVADLNVLRPYYKAMRNTSCSVDKVRY